MHCCTREPIFRRSPDRLQGSLYSVYDTTMLVFVWFTVDVRVLPAVCV